MNLSSEPFSVLTRRDEVAKLCRTAPPADRDERFRAVSLRLVCERLDVALALTGTDLEPTMMPVVVVVPLFRHGDKVVRESVGSQLVPRERFRTLDLFRVVRRPVRTASRTSRKEREEEERGRAEEREKEERTCSGGPC